MASSELVPDQPDLLTAEFRALHEGRDSIGDQVEGRELHARRLALGLSQDALADMLAVTQASVSRWEAGARRIPAGINNELIDLEDRVEELVATHLRAGREVIEIPAGAGPVVALAAVAAARALVARRRAEGTVTHILTTSASGEPQ